MSEKEKLALLEKTFWIEEGSLIPDMVLAEIDEYDSMAKVSLVVMMEDEFGISLDGSSIKEFVTVRDILNKMESER